MASVSWWDVDWLLQEASELCYSIIYNDSSSISMKIIIAIIVVVITVLVLITRKVRQRGQQNIPTQPQPRFRKRDKVIFYGRKMLRKVRSLSSKHLVISNSQARLRRRLSLTRKYFRARRDSEPILQIKEPPASVLEPDWMSAHIDDQLPPEVTYMLKSVRVFGHFEKPVFLELCRHIESKYVPTGAYLFKAGQPDDSIYVVQNGALLVSINDPEVGENRVKEVGPGENIHSLLSVLDVLTDHSAPYKTVSARATKDSIVLRLPVLAFKDVFKKYPETMVRVIQMIMIRLQRVTFLALHSYLGLTNELIKPEHWVEKHEKTRTPAANAGGGHHTSPRPTPKRSNSREKQPPPSVSSLPVHDRGAKSQPIHVPVPRRPSLEVNSLLDMTSFSDSDFDVACGIARVRSGSSGRSLENIQESFESHHRNTNRPFSLPTELPAAATVLSGIPHSDINNDDNDNANVQPILDDLAKCLGLEDTTLLENRVVLATIPAATTLAKEGDQEASLVYIVSGALHMCQTDKPTGKLLTVFVAHGGSLVNTLAVLTGEPQYFSVISKHESRVAVISKVAFYSIMREEPSIVLNVAHTIVTVLSPFVRQIDFALDWVLVDAGRALFRQGEHATSTYIVLTGRLRSVVQHQNGKKELLEEYGRGDIAGFVEVLTQSERVSTVHAVRDTELAKMPEGLLNFVKRKYPHVVTRLIQLLSEKMIGQTLNSANKRSVSALTDQPYSRPALANLSTVAVIPVSDKVPLQTFSVELAHALDDIAPTLRLTSEIIRDKLGNPALDCINEYRLSNWLAQQEDSHRTVLYVSDNSLSHWTRRCLRQADCILIIANACDEPTVGEIEKQMEKVAVRAQKELILLHKGWHDPETERPRRTVEWLNIREWCNSHHHIRCPKHMYSKKSPTRLMDMYRKILEQPVNKFSGFSRLARFLTGTSYGLVLGGGGARGISQMGIIKAMKEAGIPIDMVGGTSIGSLVGAIYADTCHTNFEETVSRLRLFSQDMTSIWKKVIDLTYPISSMFSGTAFNNGIRAVFGDRQIEDLWIPYFAISTDISSSRMRVHTSGSLWRYVRASMSLSGYLPPLCDPKDGHLLLDGGYVNNVPADVMKAMGAGTIIAVDVGSKDDAQLTNYGDYLSGWWLLFKRWNPWATPVKVPDMEEIQSRLAYISCIRLLDELKNSEYCEYIRPPIDRYKTLQFGSFEEIMDVGLEHGRTVFSGLLKGNVLQNMLKTVAPRAGPNALDKTVRFTDLAELVSRIEKPVFTLKYESDSDDVMYDELDDDDEDDDDDDDDEIMAVLEERDMSTGEEADDEVMLQQTSLSDGDQVDLLDGDTTDDSSHTKQNGEHIRRSDSISSDISNHTV